MKQLAVLTLLLFTLCGWGQMTPTYDDIWIPMRDGELLQADVFIPDGVTSGEVVLIQTPYNKNFYSFSLPMGVGTDLDDQPFIWVIVDWRGFYGSSGADLSDFARGEDGYDVCQWISEQDWHGDRIGTWGPSALGSVQYHTAREEHPNHTCAVPMVNTGAQSYETYFYGGVLEEARLFQLDALGYGLSPLVLANPYDNLLWQIAEEGSYFPSEIHIPTLQIGGWYDHTINAMMDFYKDSRNVADPAVTDEQWLLVGPWVHGGTGAAYVGSAIQGELLYPDAEFKSDTMAWDFLNYYLLDADNGWEDTDYITYYELGGNDIWHTSNEDDIHAVETNLLYLDNGGKLSGSNGVGSSAFVSDPSNPSPTIGGATLSEDLEQGPYDQSSLDSRTDIATFSTAVLTGQVAITGRVNIRLYIECDQPDADIAIRLVDVYPDGRNMLITDGIKRMRFRNNEYTVDDEVFMVPGEVYAVDIDLPFTNYTWLAGHEIKIYVSGNHASRFNVNLQDGGEMYVEGTGNVANITVHHTTAYPSAITLPGDNPILSIAEEGINFEVYPNPTMSELVVQGPQFSTYAIYNVLGKQCVQTSNLSNQRIDVSALSQGMYILQLTTEEGLTVQQKFTKI
ncbi:MAG: CocE/NonD family hydrolase [Crocinitomix sp.]|nr:CocE/NonD family hydrolase [Crocinitomix sp.]